ncbi:hypothetical protein IMSAGC013_01606 [Lachnospiraceae bacterium]|nr:hypothetical protein IMSAGC013_01606 [Lachnospiraceae bacterium]
MPQRRVRPIPHLLRSPVRIIRRPIDHRIKRRVHLPPAQNILRLLVLLKTDRMPVRPRRSDQKKQRLCPGIPGTLRHHVKQLPVRLAVQLVKNNRMDIQPVFRISLRRQHLVKTVGRLIHQPLHRHHRLDPPLQRRALLHHVHRHIKHNRSLLPVRSAPIHLRAPLIVPTSHIKRHPRRQLRLPVLLRNLHISRIILPKPVLLHRPEHIPDDRLLPRQQIKRLPPPSPLRMFQTADKLHRPLRLRLIKHYPPPPLKSRISMASLSLSSPASATIRLREEGVSPNCSQNRFIIFK